MTPWTLVLALEAIGVAVLLVLAHRVHGAATRATRSWRALHAELTPALARLRHDTERTGERLDALRRRGQEGGPH